MTFSEFAQMMRRYIIEKNTDEYIRKLTDLIWEEPYPEDIGEDEEIGNKKAVLENYKNEICNPLYDYRPNTLIKIYDGTYNISKEKANMILANFNGEKFAELIDNDLKDDAKNDLKNDLEKVGVKIKKNMSLGKNAPIFLNQFS